MIKTIENGSLDIGLWVTYKCNVGCPHCYLKSMTNKSKDLTLENFEFLLNKIQEYKKNWNDLTIALYGAEPQSLPVNYYYDLIEKTKERFSNAVFVMYTSLQKLDNDWISLFKKIDHVSVSYDGLMRGEKYNETLFKNIDILAKNNIKVSIMTVLNKTVKVDDYLKVIEIDSIKYFGLKPFLPIMNQRNNFNEWSVPMEDFSKFCIDLHTKLIQKKLDYKSAMIQQILKGDSVLNNIGANTIFIDGDLKVMYMAYKNKEEYLQIFGYLGGDNKFEDVINSKQRKDFIQDQRLLNQRQDCITCEYAKNCIAEVFKEDYDNSNECTGAKKFIEWVVKTYGF